jgi:hypothetical protein
MINRDSRKLYTFKVSLRGVDLDNLEDLLDSIPICGKHKANGLVFGTKEIPERELMTMYYQCADCKKVHDAHMKALARVYSQLCRQYFR